MTLEDIRTEIMNLPIESQWQLLEDLIKNLRVRSEQEQNSHFDIRIPNKTTLKVIAEAEKGRNLIECDDADDLFRKLGITQNAPDQRSGFRLKAEAHSSGLRASVSVVLRRLELLAPRGIGAEVGAI